MTKANVGLGFDVSAFRKGVTNASQIVRRGLGDDALKPFNRSVAKSARNMRRKFRNATRSISRGLFSIQGLVLGLGVAKLASEIRELGQESRDLADSVTLLRTAAEAEGVEINTRRFEQLAQDIQRTLGVSAVETNRAAAMFLGRGFNADQSAELARLSASAMKAFNLSGDRASRLIADALNGSEEAVKRIGIEFESTGDEIQDAAILSAKLRARFDELGADLVNPSERLDGILMSIRQTLGGEILQTLDPILIKVGDFLAGWEVADMENNIRQVGTVLGGIGITVGRIVDLVQSLIALGSEIFAQIGVGISTNVRYVESVLRDFIPALIKRMLAEALGNVVDTIGNLPGGDKILARIGLDDAIVENLERGAKQGFNAFQASASSLVDVNKQAYGALGTAFGNVGSAVNGQGYEGAFTNRVKDYFSDRIELGQEFQEASRERIAGPVDGGGAFVSDVLRQGLANRQAASPTQTTQAPAGIDTGALGIGDGQRVSVTIRSASGSDRFRRSSR